MVTGGASGLGLSICQHLARAGQMVGVMDVDADAAERVAADLRAEGAGAIAVGVDVSDEAAVTAAFDTVRNKLGAVEILVTSAAIAEFVPLDKITLDAWTRVMTVNLTGTFLCIRAALTDMVASGWGRIVTISAAGGQVGAMQLGHYSASKGGVIALTKTAAREYASCGITVNTVSPFSADTPMLRDAQSAEHLPSGDILAQAIPAGRVGTGDDIAATCAFLCSDAAGYITGQVIGVNGGAII